jgi:hypothetical protein
MPPTRAALAARTQEGSEENFLPDSALHSWMKMKMRQKQTLMQIQTHRVVVADGSEGYDGDEGGAEQAGTPDNMSGEERSLGSSRHPDGEAGPPPTQEQEHRQEAHSGHDCPQEASKFAQTSEKISAVCCT